MKQIKSIFISSFLLIALFSALVAANTQTSEPTTFTALEIKEKSTLDPTFYAEISFLLSEGDGCGCTPIRQVLIWTEGLTTDHNDSGLTDDDGICILELEFDQEYRVHIEIEGFHRVLFDFTVNDDQSFTFHMKQKNVSIPTTFPRFSQLINQLESIKTILAQ